jgi:hypothetical protein
VTIPRRQIVHVGLKIFYNAALVCRSQVRPRVCKRNRTNSGVVRLEDRLEVESEPIPEGEFSTR